MKKLAVVEYCTLCPHFLNDKFYCEKAGRKYKLTRDNYQADFERGIFLLDIPEWCPLEDAE